MLSSTRLLLFATVAAAFGIAAISPWNVVAPEASANENDESYWQETPGGENACAFLDMPWDGIQFICADWITEDGPLVTCCVELGAFQNHQAHDLNDCHTLMFMPTTDDREGL